MKVSPEFVEEAMVGSNTITLSNVRLIKGELLPDSLRMIRPDRLKTYFRWKLGTVTYMSMPAGSDGDKAAGRMREPYHQPQHLAPLTKRYAARNEPREVYPRLTRHCE